MKAQNFTFMKEMVPLIISGRKFITNRIATPFRQKLEVGGTMYIFTGMRTPNCKKIGDAKVLSKTYWSKHYLPRPPPSPYGESPLANINWEQFAWIDGFDTYKEFYDYFYKRRDKSDELGFICYKFKFSMER